MQSSLLSPAESHAFQSFLSTMDYPDDTLTAAEWAIYNSGAPMYGPHDDPLDESSANPAQREALAKATKDLMSLEPDGWNRDAAMMEPFDPRGHYDPQQHQHQQQQEHHHFAQRQQALQHLQQQQQQHIQHQVQQQRQHSFSSGSDLFPFLHNNNHKGSSSSQELRYPMQRLGLQQHPHLGPSAAADHGSPTSSHSPFSFGQQSQHNLRSLSHHQQHLQQQQQQQQQQHMRLNPHQVHIPAHHQLQEQLSPSSSNSNNTLTRNGASSSTKRASVSRSSSALAGPSHMNIASSSSTSANGGRGVTNGVPSSSSKRSRTSNSPPPSASSTSTQLGVNAAGVGVVGAKPTLLSPDQKKANHIQSEQKRRANIRRGYEALCETVPALREAIREEEEAERRTRAIAGNGGHNGSNGGGGGRAGGGRKKRSGKKGALDEKDKDRMDGRAGPRSENVVLSKTIDHIQSLIADRSALLVRLHRARSSLPPGHPALTPLVPDPPWEREWKGGNGRLGDESEEEEEGEGE
ncbi:hypothetical protein BDN70DRAFT_860292 [Pholiota conissans]|uniref:BHLH domain-containing protein n=1 Tax=Pholiota conissans TaxID=109636 RepID=A0A9P6CTD7_9AGAR|nr:hypothetical protein BDN70DRAFT_860292 [Pholiota conissans]